MPRNVTQEVIDQYASGSVYPVILAQMFFDSGTIGMWTGYGTIEYDGIEYFGGGNFIGISPIKETQETKAEGVVVSLNGIPSSLIALALTEKVRGRPFRLSIATAATSQLVLTEAQPGSVLTEEGDNVLLENEFATTPYRIFSGMMDYMEFTDNGETANIRLYVESVMIIGQRNKPSRYTPEEQRKLYAGDKGLDLINRLQDAEIVW